MTSRKSGSSPGRDFIGRNEARDSQLHAPPFRHLQQAAGGVVGLSGVGYAEGQPESLPQVARRSLVDTGPGQSEHLVAFLMALSLGVPVQSPWFQRVFMSLSLRGVFWNSMGSQLKVCLGGVFSVSFLARCCISGTKTG